MHTLNKKSSREQENIKIASKKGYLTFLNIPKNDLLDETLEL